MLSKELFDFEYRWEIYTPAVKRKYGFYVLPILFGERFVGRIEAVSDKKTGVLTVKNIWFEDGIKQTKKLLSAIQNCVKRFARFNECKEVRFLNEDIFITKNGKIMTKSLLGVIPADITLEEAHVERADKL